MPQLIASVEGVEIKHIYLEKDRTTLGRRPGNDIIFDNLIVSGLHCVFELKGIADVYVEDVGSTNGTFVNGHMIKSPEKLRDGDVLTIGNFQVEYLASSTHEKAPAQQATRTMALDALGLTGTSGSQPAALKVLAGLSPGLELPLVKAVTTFGQPGVAVVSISHRRDGYYASHVSGSETSTLNGKALDATAVLLEDHDVLEMSGTAMEFLLKGS